MFGDGESYKERSPSLPKWLSGGWGTFLFWPCGGWYIKLDSVSSLCLCNIHTALCLLYTHGTVFVIYTQHCVCYIHAALCFKPILQVLPAIPNKVCTLKAWPIMQRMHTPYVGLPYPYICTPYMTVYLVESLPRIPYIRRVYLILANPTCTKVCMQWFCQSCPQMYGQMCMYTWFWLTLPVLHTYPSWRSY